LLQVNSSHPARESAPTEDSPRDVTDRFLDNIFVDQERELLVYEDVIEEAIRDIAW
jgi:hypothetical protein